MRLKPFYTATFALFAFICFVQSTQAFYTNMSATTVIGQPNFTSNSANQGGSAGANTLRSPYFSYYDSNSGKFFISDVANHRILIFNQIPTSNNVSADVVVGQPNFTSGAINQGGSTAANTFNDQGQLVVAGNKLIVADYGNHRVLIFNQIPTTNNASADVVIGQTNFTNGSGNQGGSAAANTLRNPWSITYDPTTGKLFVGDYANARLLIYNQIPTTNNASADVVVGQPDFSTVTTGTTASKYNNAIYSVRVLNNKLFVADASNHRVLIYNQVPTSNGAAADVVIGQQNFTTGSSNQGGSVGPSTLASPEDMEWDGKRLFIADAGNRRVLIYNQIPTQNNFSAITALGQPDLTHNSVNQGGSVAANTMSSMGGVRRFENKLFVGEQSNNRVLIFHDEDTAPGLSILNSPESVDNGLIKLTGNASTLNHYTIQNVQYMINGGGFNGATATDGSFDSISENFFFTFDPKSNNNSNDGYTVQIKSTTSNVDTTDHLFYFQPFQLNTPADRSFESKQLPTFEFSVNKQQIQLKENISKYQVMLRKSGGDWKAYIESVPVDYETVRDSSENYQKSPLSTNGNGVFDDKKIYVTYSNNNSTIAVKSKAIDEQGNSSSLTFDQGGKLLSNGGYEWKVVAIDKNGHTQETETRKFVVGASAFSNGSNWFPLQINSISGLGRVYLSTINPQFIKSKYRIQTSNPVFSGIATANSTVQLDLTNQTCLTTSGNNCAQTFTANSNGASQFTLSTSANTLKTGSIYQAQFSVSQNGLFNALPPFQITR